MRRPSRHSRRDAGFTLVEALVATLLMTFILAALATVTAQWLPNWSRGMDRAQRVELFATGVDRLIADLAAAEYVSADNGKFPIFNGTSLSVTFVRTAIGPNVGTGLEVVHLGEAAGDGGPALVRRTAPFVPDRSQGSADRFAFANPVVVIRSPYRVSFSYAGPDRVWRDSWQGQTQLPRAVRISVRDRATSRTLAVTTSVPIEAELPMRCVGAQRTPECPVVSSTAMTATVPNATTAPASAAPAPAGAAPAMSTQPR